MGYKPGQRALEALKIIAELQQIVKKDELKILEIPSDNPETLREAIRMRIRGARWERRVVMSCVDITLIVMVKEISYTQKLENVLRKFMLQTDNELLYEEAQNILEENNGLC